MGLLIERHVWGHADEVIGFQNNIKININSFSEMNNLGRIIFKNSKKVVNFKFTFDFTNFKDENDAREKLKKIISEFQKISSTKHDKKTIEKRIIPNKNKELDFEKRKDIKIIKKELLKELWNRTEKELVKYTYEKIYVSYATLENCFVAIHTKGFDNKYSVKPHIHILFSKEKNHFGYGFQGLVKGIRDVCQKYNLVSSIEKLEKDLEESEEIELKNLNQRLSRFSWGIAKNPNFIGKEDGKYSINLKNVQAKVDRYLELGGCVAFCEKIKIRLADRGISLRITKPKTEVNAEINLSQKKYIDIINEVSNRVAQKKKIPEAYRNYAGYLNNENSTKKDSVLKMAIKSLFQKSLKNLREELTNLEEVKKIADMYINRIKELEKEELEEKIKKEYIEKLENSGYINYLAQEIRANQIQNEKCVDKNDINEFEATIKEIISNYKIYDLFDNIRNKENILKINYFIYRIVFRDYFDVLPKIDIEKLGEINEYTGDILYQYAEKVIISELKEKKYMSESELNKDYKLVNDRIEKKEDSNLYIFKSDVKRLLNMDLHKYYEDNIYEKVKEIIKSSVNNLETNNTIENKIDLLGIFKCRDEVGRKTDEYKNILNRIYEEFPKLKRTPLYLIENKVLREKIEEIYYKISDNYLNCYFDLENNLYIEPICRYINEDILEISRDNDMEILMKLCKIMEIDVDFEYEDLEEIFQNETKIEEIDYNIEIK